MPDSTADAPAPPKWFEALPAPKSSPQRISCTELHELMVGKQAGIDYVVVDVRRADIEVCEEFLRHTAEASRLMPARLSGTPRLRASQRDQPPGPDTLPDSRGCPCGAVTVSGWTFLPRTLHHGSESRGFWIAACRWSYSIARAAMAVGLAALPGTRTMWTNSEAAAGWTPAQ